ncbi:MAG: hypothetical protein KAQ98_05675 [Bacteriovoracaceae bacterium]|nr:hypothetical protein [Bacteriovoracaceae bacterium]
MSNLIIVMLVMLLFGCSQTKVVNFARVYKPGQKLFISRTKILKKVKIEGKHCDIYAAYHNSYAINIAIEKGLKEAGYSKAIGLSNVSIKEIVTHYEITRDICYIVTGNPIVVVNN